MLHLHTDGMQEHNHTAYLLVTQTCNSWAVVSRDPIFYLIPDDAGYRNSPADSGCLNPGSLMLLAVSPFPLANKNREQEGERSKGQRWISKKEKIRIMITFQLCE